MTVVADADADHEAGNRPGRFPVPPRPARALGALAAAWLLPLTAHAVGADLLVLLAAWAAIASQLHAGRLLLDRLVLAGILLAGLLITLGLVFSVWPWGLEPVPVGGVTLSVVALAGAASGRRPRLPFRFAASDSLVVGAGVLSWHYLNAPTRGKGFVQRLPYIAAREDFFNHYTLYDTIHRIGGYPFLKRAATAPYSSPTQQNPTALRFYPAGMHYLDALFDIFLRSTTDPGGSIGEYDRFVLYSILNLALLAAAVVWAARWIAGPGLAGWRRAAVCALVGGLAAVGQLSTLYWQGFNAQAAGLVVLTLAAAVMARPPRAVHEQVLLVCAMVICATFVYNLTALMVLGMAGIAGAVYWRRLLRHWRFVAAVGVPALAVAVVPYVAPMFGGFSASSKFLAWGTSVRFSRTLSVAVGLAGVSAMASRNGRRSPVWRAASLSVVWCCALTVGMGFYAYEEMGVTNYYYEKLVEGAWVVSLACLGAVGMLLKAGPALGAVGALGRFGRRSENFVAGGVAVLMALVTAGVFQLTTVRFPDWVPKQDVTWGSVWRAGYVSSGFWTPLASAARHGLIGDDKPTIILFSDSGHDNRSATMFAGAVDHDRGLITDAVIDQVAGSDGLATLRIASGGVVPAAARQSLDNFESLIQKCPVALRIVVWNDDVGAALTRFGAAHPELGLSVVVLHD